MNKITIFAVSALFMGIAASAQGQTRTLEVSFNYEKQAGPGSNQYAVWVENTKGDVVKTLFVTSFTTKGRARNGEELVRGYVKRPACVPVWVKNAKAQSLSDSQMDAFTGSTPDSGVQTFTWDFKDQSGKKVKKGDYRICVEATLFNQSDILYTGEFNTEDKAGSIKLKSTLTEKNEEHAGMVTNVKASIRK